ncbi:Odorant receptor 83c [Culex quinquefasciatus]|uniref:Odorant receptor 83c n=1 Tax=Culex quinquefasciatus TaxID=7176 RepID=B0WDY5_CULQU|nr:Odorant receptor 83c [Culex quinquefasciatus]|eukprot:XP_001846919.1 Odorant receptor 83c [Culex quinquefasciatus]
MHNVVNERAAVNAGSLPEFRKSFETVRKASYLVGVALFTRESDLNVRFFGTSTIIALVYGCCLYSGWFLRSDWNRLLELSVCLLLNLQGTSKLWTGFVQKLRYCELFQTTERIYECFDVDERNRPILREVVSKMNLFIKWIVIVYRNEKLITEKLVRICKLHQMIVEFEQDAVEHFKYGCAVQILFQAGTLMITIFLSYICGYVQAASIFMALLFQLTQYCALGTIVTAKNDQMTIDIYGIEWYRLGNTQQQIVVFMLHRAQTAKDLSVGGIAPLNVETYVKGVDCQSERNSTLVAYATKWWLEEPGNK